MKIRLYGVKKKSTMYVWMYIIYWHNLTIKQVKNSLERMSILEKNFRVQLGIVGVHGVQSQFLACTKRCLSLNRRSVFLILSRSVHAAFKKFSNHGGQRQFSLFERFQTSIRRAYWWWRALRRRAKPYFGRDKERTQKNLPRAQDILSRLG